MYIEEFRRHSELTSTHALKTGVKCSYGASKEVNRHQLEVTFGMASLYNVSWERTLILFLPLLSFLLQTKLSTLEGRERWEQYVGEKKKQLWPTPFLHKQPAHTGLQQEGGAPFNFKSSWVFSVSYALGWFEILNWKCVDTGSDHKIFYYPIGNWKVIDTACIFIQAREKKQVKGTVGDRYCFWMMFWFSKMIELESSKRKGCKEGGKGQIWRQNES